MRGHPSATHTLEKPAAAGSPAPPVPTPMNFSKHLLTDWLGFSTVKLCGWKKRDLGGILRYVRAQKCVCGGGGGDLLPPPPLPGKGGEASPPLPPPVPTPMFSIAKWSWMSSDRWRQYWCASENIFAVVWRWYSNLSRIWGGITIGSACSSSLHLLCMQFIIIRNKLEAWDKYPDNKSNGLFKRENPKNASIHG